MALILNGSANFLEISLDGVIDFDCTADLVALGMRSNAPDGLRVRKIIFIPSAVGDEIIVRDGQNGPRMFDAETLGTWDKLKDNFRDDGAVDKGKVCKPYIHANETVVGVVNQAYVIFEL